ncbi:uncharacterized protein RJT20DRAFT_129872 [Scheffersomyces xylosifermentans]|uniref:uncharacterized protein n=1 Tax=Scheffersomyces xylosifermentans TaxID=1304137 RepID=UPI00315D75CA
MYIIPRLAGRALVLPSRALLPRISIKSIPRIGGPIFSRFNTTTSTKDTPETELRKLISNNTKVKHNVKKKTNIQKLRRTDPNFQSESTTYILSLLNDNSSPTFPAASKTLEKYLSIVTSVTVGESVDFEALLPSIKGYDYRILIPDEVININFNGKDLMILSNGTLVGWDLEEDVIIKHFLPLVEDAIVEKYEFESDEMDWIELNSLPTNPLNNGNSYLQGEIMVVQGSTKDKRDLDKAAFAIGLSRSTRLAILENALEVHLLLTKKNTELLAKGKRITTSESDFLKSTGRLFLLRGKLNLYSELIETPDLYWSEPTLEKIYDSVSRILDINSRISILNRKLDYATEEQRAFLGVLNEKKSTRLEWIIIILIMVEVCFETFHFYEKYSDSKRKHDEE